MSVPRDMSATELGGREPKPSSAGPAAASPARDLNQLVDVMALALELAPAGPRRISRVSYAETRALARGLVACVPIVLAAAELVGRSRDGAAAEEPALLVKELVDATREVM